MSHSDLQTSIDEVQMTFQHRVSDVFALMEFDDAVLQFAIASLQKFQDAREFNNPARSLEGTIKALQNVRRNESLSHKYDTIMNQCIVLLVSHFGSSLKDLFVAAVAHCVTHGLSAVVQNEEVKVTIRQMRAMQQSDATAIAELLAEAKDFSFQDLGSTTRAFEKYLGCTLRRDVTFNTVAFSQAARNAIVHSGSRADDRLLRQIAMSSPRLIKQTVLLDEFIQFTSDEIGAVTNSMTNLLRNVSEAVSKAHEC
jgi:hypothetical protein